MPPAVVVTVDTEEEFDWQAPLSSGNRSVTHISALARLQEICEPLGIRPSYLVDHPVATTETSIRVLSEIHRRGACEIGTHLHPWVTPPLEEDICPGNSFLMNLPLELQRAKVEEMTRVIKAHFGVSPRSFKAGRYGIHFGLVPTLQELGYWVDSSVLPFYSFLDEVGPDFTQFDPEPFLLRPPVVPETPDTDPLLEVPCTVGWNRPSFRFWSRIHQRLAQPLWRRFRLIGILWRLGIMRRIVLTPEGFPLDDLKRLMRVLVARGNTILNMTLHSPSLEPGHTHYVRSRTELHTFLNTLAGALRFAIQELGARPHTLSECALAFRKDLPS